MEEFAVTCQVIISDYVAQRRMIYLLDAADFHHQSTKWRQDDPLLEAFQNHAFFAGCRSWGDLDLRHFHALIINMLNISADHSDTEVANKMHPTVLRLSFFLCSIIRLIQQRSGCVIDLFRVNRIGREEVLYDYSARLDVTILAPKTPGLRVVIDNA